MKTDGLGLPETARIEFDWKWYWTALRILPWLLIAFLLLLRPNRTRAAWAVLLPLAVIAALAWIESCFSTSIAGIGEEEASRHAAFAFGLAVLCLATAWFPAKPRLARSAAFWVLFLTSALSLVFLGGLCFQWTDVRPVWVRPAFQAAGFMAALALVRLARRKRFRPRLFVFWLTLCVLAVGWIASFSYLLLSETYEHLAFPASLLSMTSLPQCLLHFAQEALADCITACIILLPFLLLARFSSLIRERLGFLGPGLAEKADGMDGMDTVSRMGGGGDEGRV